MAEDEREVPSGRWGRLTRLAGAGARASAGMLLRGSGEQAAKKAAEVLGTLRGVATKAGQMAAYVDGLVPEEQRETYELWMKGLMAAAPKSSSAAIRLEVEAQLQASIDELFADWQDDALASASIGQVHRARLHDGREVAVKVQHPGIAEAMESDLKNVGLLEHFAALAGSRKFDSQQVLREFRERMREELDYALEAERQEAFRAIHADDLTIRIPEVVRSHCAPRVLTTELVRAQNFDAACAASEDERRRWAETMWRFVFKGTLVGGMFNADPHPGNYLFDADGKVWFLDFGCVQAQDMSRRDLALAVHRAAILRDEASFRASVTELLGTRGGDYERWALDYVRRCFEPLFASPFRITRPYAATMVEGIRNIAKAAPRLKKDEVVPLPEGMFFMNRLQCGFYSVLARLDVEVDYAAVERDFLTSEF